MSVLAGKTAIVTGSARGIGRAAAELLAEHGAQSSSPTSTPSLPTRRRPSSATPWRFGGDLTADGVPEALVRAAVDSFGRLDIVVNNAGYTWDGMAHKMSDDQFRAMLEIHTVAPFRLLRAAAPHLRDAGKADREAGREVFRKVVNVTSISGTQGNVGQANYSAAKAGLVGLTKSLAREWGPFKVNVNAVAFGFVETRLTAASDDGGETIKRGDAEIRSASRRRCGSSRRRSSRWAGRRRRRRPPARSSSSARPGRTSSTVRCSPRAAARRRG